MEENKKKNKGLIVLIILLIMCVIGLCGYIVYNKLFENSKVNNSITTTTISQENNEEQSDETIDELMSYIDLVGEYKSINDDMGNVCLGYSGLCSEIVFKNIVVNGKDLSLKYKLYNSMNILRKYHETKLSYGKIDKVYNEEISNINNEEVYYINAKELIDIINKFYNSNYTYEDYKSIEYVQSINVIDVQGVYLAQVENVDVYCIYAINNDLPSKRYINHNNDFEKNGEYIYLYTDSIANIKVGYREGEDAIINISKIDNSETIDVEENIFDISYEKYRDFYTKYKMTYKINSDDTYTFISSEPILN